MTHLSARDWGVSIVIGALAFPVAVIVKLIPTEPIAKFCYRYKLLQDPNKLPTERPQADEHEYNAAIEKVRDNLATFGQIRGGRLRSSSFVGRSRTTMLKKKDVHPGALMTMVRIVLIRLRAS